MLVIGGKSKYRQFEMSLPVCRDSNAAYSRADFIVPKNSICYLGRKVYGKAGRFTAIRCTDGLEGWMIEDSSFRSVK